MPEIQKIEQSFITIHEINKELIDVDIDSIADFNSLINIIEEISCGGQIGLVKMETKDKIFRVQPLFSCGDIFDYKLRQIIYVNPDSVTVNSELNYPISDLKMVLQKHIHNSENDKNYPEQDKIRMISINVGNDKPISITKNLILEIIYKLNELDYKNNLSFKLENHDIIKAINE